MNAAFLLVTSAWLAGADPAPPPPAAKPAAPAPVAAAPATYSGSCGCDTGCNTCCDEESWWSRMKGRFHRNRCCEESCNTCNTCNTCTTYSHPIVHSSCNTCNPCNTCNTCECDPCASRWSRFRGLFSRHHEDCGCGCETSCNTCNSCGTTISAPAATTPGAPPAKMPPAGEPIKAPKGTTELPAKELPKGTTAAPTLDLTPTASKPLEETKNPFELHRRMEQRVSRAADYSWVTGQLQYVHADGGLWVLRFAPIWKEEADGGSVVLARDVPMDSYREGDLVQVRGEVLQPKASPSLGGPLYRVETIQLLDRPNR